MTSETKAETMANESKERGPIIVVGSSSQVEVSIDKVESLPAALL
jgi:hypothetical protein